MGTDSERAAALEIAWRLKEITYTAGFGWCRDNWGSAVAAREIASREIAAGGAVGATFVDLAEAADAWQAALAAIMDAGAKTELAIRRVEKCRERIADEEKGEDKWTNNTESC